jgi:hypothetical protein
MDGVLSAELAVFLKFDFFLLLLFVPCCGVVPSFALITTKRHNISHNECPFSEVIP